MGVYRIYSERDTWITDAHPERSLTIRASGSNHGRSPALNVFARKADINSASIELARTLVSFSVTQISGLVFQDRLIPSSSVSYILKMYDMKHNDIVPSSYDLFVYPLSRSWDEGKGIDDDELTDDGYASWLSASSTQGWTVTGSDYLTHVSASQHFDAGDEDLEVDITSIVNEWLTGSMSNRRHGLVLKMGNTEETNGTNYYRKVLHSRESKYIDRLPCIEIRWNDVKKDNRRNFAFNQNSSLYLYNLIRGELTDLSEPVLVRIQDKLVSGSYSQTLTASKVETGIYSASLTIVNTASFSGSTWYDIWYSGSFAYMTGNFTPIVLTGSQVDPYEEFDLDVTNLKRVYGMGEEARLIVNVRSRNYVTHVGVVGSSSLNMNRQCIEKMYYSIENDETGEVVIPFGSGAIPYTQLSYNKDGNYFNLWMNNFVPGLKYRIKFLIDINKYDKKIIDDGFTFKVV